MGKKKDYTNMDECVLIVNHVNAKLKRSSGTNIFIIGLPGTGKSSQSMRIGEKIIDSREETTKVFITGSLLEILDALKSSRIGDVLIVEEGSILFPARRAMASENVAIGKILDSIRKKCLCLIVNCPIWKSLDSHVRNLGDILIETLGIDKTNKVVVSKFHRLQTNPDSGKIYKHTFQRKGRDVNRLYTKMPDSAKWIEYETNKDKFIETLHVKLKREQIKKEAKLNKGFDKPIVKPRDLTEREKQVNDLHYTQGMTKVAVGLRLGISDRRVGDITKQIIKKGEMAKEFEKKRVRSPIPVLST